MKRAKPLLCRALIFLLSGCAVFAPVEKNESPPEETAVTAAVEPPERVVEPAPPEWVVRSLNQVTARVEFSGGDTTDTVECGVSFFNAIRDPKTVTAVLLVADGELYPLEGFKIIFVKSETHELRISVLIPRKSLLTVLEAGTVYLVAVIDKIEYQFEPDGDFAAYKNRVLKDLEARNEE